MARGKKYCCLVLSGFQPDRLPAFARNSELDFIRADNMEDVFSILRSRFTDCLILPANLRQDSVCDEFSAFTAEFPSIPVLVIIDSSQIDLTCRLGQLGAKYVADRAKPDKIETLLRQIVGERYLRGVHFIDLKRDNLSSLIRNALHLVENYYPTCRKVKDIAARLNITEATLCREFKKQCGVSCKTTLLFLQVVHCAEQMRNGRLQIKQIAYGNGFKHPERFTEAFSRITGMTPNEYRKQVEPSSFEIFWQYKWQKIKKT